MARDEDLATINGLIRTTIDSIKGYEDAAEHGENANLAELFRRFAADRRQVVGQLQQEVTRLGGEPEDEGSVAAAAHRTFMDLRQAIAGRSDRAIVEEVERGEDHLKEKYESALADGALSPEVRSVIEQAYLSVRAGHDQASALKHGFAGQ